ncbi:UNVERIFIED_CONTAM: Transposon Ty3-G Gag-Pol polyprotein [Sesamum radiatum]|uniref:Transposon Ty3-G Gag-Pol polyprotein n=1 Tax=Sesamum radiatum TaxID=300843 RepID=A0AAW2S701_SESRA
MEEDVEAYVRTCLVCQLDKVERKKEAGLLQPLPIPEVPWQSVSMDFITGFPKTLLVTGMPGLPEGFGQRLFNMMGTELKFSTANHPQTDGQTERVNALVEDYLRHYVSASQRNWVDLLDVAQFSYNLHKSSATGMSRFKLAYGQQPTTPHEVSVQRTGGKCPAAYRYARSKQELLDEAKDSLAKAQRRMKKYADMGRRHVEFNAGDQVLLKLTPQIWKKISSKSVHRGLIPKYDGPFEVMSKVGSLAYRLKLPDRLKIHPTFHVSFLKKFHQDLLDAARQQTQRAPPVIRKEFEKTVLKILDHRTMGQSKKNRRTDYLVHWSGESEADATWERDVTLWQFEGKLDEYWAVRKELHQRGRRGVVCNPLLGWYPALVWQACASGRGTVSAWGDTARHSQTVGRSGCQAAVCASRRAAHSGRTAWQTRAGLGVAQHSAAISCAQGLGSSVLLRWNSAALGSGREHSAAKCWGSAAVR